MKGRGRGLLAVVSRDQDKSVGRVDPERRSIFELERHTSNRCRSGTVAATGGQSVIESSFTSRKTIENIVSTGSPVSRDGPNTETVATSQLPHADLQQTPSSSAASVTASHDPTGDQSSYHEWRHTRSRSQSNPRYQQGHRLNRLSRQNQKKYYQQLDYFLEDHKRQELQSDVKQMISRNRERTRQKEDKIRLSREALEEEKRKQMELKTEKERTDEDTPTKEQQGSKEVEQKVTANDVESVRKQLEDVLKRMTIDTYHGCRSELLAILNSDIHSSSSLVQTSVQQPLPVSVVTMPTSPVQGLCYSGQVRYVPVQVIPMAGANCMPQMVAVQPLSVTMPSTTQTSEAQSQHEADKSFTNFNQVPPCAICHSVDHRTYGCRDRDKWFIN